jgi:hypothetical protein
MSEGRISLDSSRLEVATRDGTNRPLITARKPLRRCEDLNATRRAAMRSLKSLLNSKQRSASTVVDMRQTGPCIVTEYILNMALSALARGDITPLYDHYLEDPRLSDKDLEELARGYLLLQMTATQLPESA